MFGGQGELLAVLLRVQTPGDSCAELLQLTVLRCSRYGLFSCSGLYRWSAFVLTPVTDAALS